MSIGSEAPGAVIVCDANGVIERVPHDRLGLADKWAPGTAFVEIVNLGSIAKAGEFIAAIHKDGGAFDWQLTLSIQDQMTLLHCMGFRDEGRLWIIVAETQIVALQMLEEMSFHQNGSSGILRAALRYAIQIGQTAKEASQFEDLTRLYNELGTMQRELAQKNAELEATRAALETQQADLMAANAKLDALATTDGLTGIANRRTFEARLSDECNRARRYGTPLSLVLLDIDQFKSLNDAYGHQAGDETLKGMGKLLTAAARATDLAARFGGEEFAVILVNSDRLNAMGAAERFRSLIAAEPWPHRAVTASLGVASFGPGAESGSDLITQADQALYLSKSSGRNRSSHFLDLVS